MKVCLAHCLTNTQNKSEEVGEALRSFRFTPVGRVSKHLQAPHQTTEAEATWTRHHFSRVGKQPSDERMVRMFRTSQEPPSLKPVMTLN